MSDQIKLELPITGMTCASCVRNVERALKKTDGVEEASVNLATERASIQFDSTQVDVNRLIQRVQDAGYGVATGTIELPITGMTCASCVRNVERAIQKQPGILSVNVNHAPLAINFGLTRGSFGVFRRFGVGEIKYTVAGSFDRLDQITTPHGAR